jgi:hypothetical protein
MYVSLDMYMYVYVYMCVYISDHITDNLVHSSWWNERNIYVYF